MRKYLLPPVFLLFSVALHAQHKTVLERFRFISGVGPLARYFNIPSIRTNIISQLSQSLADNGYPPLSDTTAPVNFEFPQRMTNFSANDIQFSNADTTNIHLYIDLLEVRPDIFFSATSSQNDTAVMARTRSVFLLSAYLFNHPKKQLFKEELDILLSHATNTGGIGALYQTTNGTLNVTPRGFADLFRLATKMLFNPKNELVQIEVKASPAYVGDNYLTAPATNHPRTFVTTTKGVSAYTLNDKREMIRQGAAQYLEMVIKGKNAQPYPANIMETIRAQYNYTHSDFVWLRQECRDVLRDKNYTLNITSQIDPENVNPQPYTFTNFLPGNVHYLQSDNDTIAWFSIEKNIFRPANKYYPGIVSNGIDTASFVVISEQPAITVQQQYVITGTIAKTPFTIRCSGADNSIKEIFLGNDLVCIAQGKFNVEKFVVFGASLSPEILNPLLLIGFNSFLE